MSYKTAFDGYWQFSIEDRAYKQGEVIEKHGEKYIIVSDGNVIVHVKPITEEQ